MDPKIEVLKEFVEFHFDALKRASEGVTEKEADWRPVEESNNIRWILNHLARITNISIPRIAKGDPEYMPEGWPADYREQHYKVEKLMADLEKGREACVKTITTLKSEQLKEEIPLWGGTRVRQTGVFAYIGEIVSHRGQIAMLRGNIKRRREKDPSFLT